MGRQLKCVIGLVVVIRVEGIRREGLIEWEEVSKELLGRHKKGHESGSIRWILNGQQGPIFLTRN